MIRLLFLLAPALSATTIGSSTGVLTYDPYNTFQLTKNIFNANSNGWINAQSGIQFTTSVDMYLNNFVAPLRLGGAGPQPVTFTLYSGAARPDVVLETSTLNMPVTNPNYALTQFDFTGNTLLKAGTAYYLISSLPINETDYVYLDWAGSSPGVPTTLWYRVKEPNTGFGSWNSAGLPTSVAWQVNAPVATPEPALSFGVGLCLISIGLGRRFTRRSKSGDRE